ncbi:hypothetical protein BGX27_008920 [Mortierella sp. AM989]|nr:hypothetical protein BGX27_008920 [Mortierella sp. AM989]
MASILKPAYAFYNRRYQARPILTICTTNAFLAGISDTLTQKYLAPSISTSTTISTPISTSTSASKPLTETIDPSSSSPSSSSTSDKTSLIKESLHDAQEHGKQIAHELAQDVEISWHEQGKDKETDMQDKIRADVERAVGQAYVEAGQEMIQKSKQGTNPDIVPDSTVVSIQATTSLDYPRMGRFMFYNFSVAPLIHTWYSVLDKNFPLAANSSMPGKNIATQGSRFAQIMAPGFKRMLADQALFAPVGLVLIFSGLTLLESGGLQDIKDKLSNTYLSTLKANYMVWPVVQLVNFSVMPLQLRLPFVSVIGIAWNAYLSLANSRGNQVEKQQQSVMDKERSTLVVASQ